MSSPKTICFLVGAPRSGTTWIQRLLQTHPAICGGEESHFFTLFAHPMQAADRMLSRNSDRKIGPLVYTDRDTYENAIREIWGRIFVGLYSENPGACVHLEKTPDHSLYLEEITRLFPDAKIIFLTRDSRAVTASLINAGKGWGSHWAPDNVRDAAIVWRRYIEAIRGWHTRNPSHPFLTIRYEDALANTEAMLDQMLDFVLPKGTPHETQKILKLFATMQEERKDPAGFARLRGKGGWRNDLSLRQKVTVWRYTRRSMRALGYEIGPI
ncbi:Sulfotransferase domain protein [Jannaschia seosinensis]|uniref:Sulfotransferase domain protein n=1 Tax=Jannaschia seosinensis TaxID=313367 RepID=A0A0M7BCE9_9RHOB|nr:sulfotransferase [Jannaschia seosinensis]CUH39492.1 Sulfotransferase domain protein [Jannaschia seosinensis]